MTVERDQFEPRRGGMRPSRMMTASGLGFAILLIGAAVVIGDWEYLPPSEDIVAFYGESPIRVIWGAYLGLLATAFLVWFSVVLAGIVRAAGEGFSRAALVGGTLAAALLGVGYVAHLVAAARARTDGGIGSEAATVLSDLGSAVMGNGAPIGFAILIGAAGLAARRVPMFPKWFGWVGLVAALGLASPLGWIFVALGLLWMVAAGPLLRGEVLEGQADARVSV